ncbi:MAG: hypothetical protein JXR34_07460 [Bacteroidales bacterium]|nr:hypothetical protein [Bacteroidales bacterium]
MIFPDKGKEYISSIPFEVTSADVDMFGRLRPGSLLNFIIQAAGYSADSLGFGYNNLEQIKLFWVLSRFNIQFDRQVRWMEKIVVHTWPKDLSGLLYLRDFQIENANEEIVGRASSAWLAIDAQSRRPKIIQGLHEPFTTLRNFHALEEIPEKLTAVSGKTVSERLVTYTDVDVNKHLTSVRYVDWIMDCFDIEYHEQFYPKQLSVNYLKENQWNESIQIDLLKMDKSVQFEGVNLQKKQSSFRAKLSF